MSPRLHQSQGVTSEHSNRASNYRQLNTVAHIRSIEQAMLEAYRSKQAPDLANYLLEVRRVSWFYFIFLSLRM